jgi:1,4-alpha-glucan branching enzyme
MGGEFGQDREWDHNSALDWPKPEHAEHQGVRAMVGDLNALYQGVPALHELDCDARGFAWIDCEDRKNCILSLLRKAEDGSCVVAILNFTSLPHRPYRVGVPHPGHYHEVFNSDSERYGGQNFGNLGGVDATPVPMHGFPQSVELTLPPLAVVLLRPADPGL